MSGSTADVRAQYRAQPATHAVNLDGEVLIWDPVGVQLHRLNDSAARVWNELAQWRSAVDIVDALSAAVSVDRVRLTEDVGRCLDELSRVGLVEHREPGNSQSN